MGESRFCPDVRTGWFGEQMRGVPWCKCQYPRDDRGCFVCDNCAGALHTDSREIKAARAAAKSN